MKKIITFLLVLIMLFSVLSVLAGCKKEYSVPNFTVYDELLHEVELEDFIGKPIVLNFWATWCYYCVLEMPDFNEAYKKHDDVQFLMINYTDGKNETVEKAFEYIELKGYEFPVYYDTTLAAAEAYGVSAFPTTFFINRKGELVAKKEGMIDAETLENYIRRIEEE